MSLVKDQISRLDALVDSFEASSTGSTPSSPYTEANVNILQVNQADVSRLQELHGLIANLSATSPTSRGKLRQCLQTTVEHFEIHTDAYSTSENDLRWLLVSKAAIQVYGIVLDAVLGQILPLSDDIWYWEQVLNSSSYSSLYMFQTSPIRFWAFGRDIVADSRDRIQHLLSGEDAHLYNSLSTRWRQYYGLVRDSVRDRSVANLQSKFASPFTLARREARHKQNNLKRLQDVNACALGILVDDGFDFPLGEFGTTTSQNDLQQIVSRSIILMETALNLLPKSSQASTKDFEDHVYSHIDSYLDDEDVDWSQPHALAQNLLNQVTVHVPRFQRYMGFEAKTNGRPRGLLRYWLPATALLLSSGTLLRIFFNHKTDIIQWVRDLGSTSSDFWYNWVVEPVKKIIGTIRHDADSEIALMSKESLRGDRDSLERMVVDFAIDDAKNSLSPAEIESIRLKIREGDLTPVLRAYEKDLKKPLMGTIRGDLIRTLLIQVQKTKVDVEVAIGGIDALLKSQELVFGFVSLTPGIIVLLGLSRWLAGSFGNRKSSSQNRQQMGRSIRNIDRVLIDSQRNGGGDSMSYRDRGLILTEIHILRQLGKNVIPDYSRHNFLTDLDGIADVRMGAANQIKLLDRLHRSYAKYFE